MKTTWPMATLALIGLCSCAGTPGAPASQPAAEASTQEFISQFLVEWEDRDSDGLAALFATDSVRVVSGEQLPTMGRAAISKSFEGTIGDPALHSQVKLSITLAHARDLGDGIVIADGRFKATDPDGNVTLTGKWGNVFRRTDGGLQLVLESAYAEPSPDADPDRFQNMSDRAAAPSRPDLGNAAAHAPALEALMGTYIKGFNTGDATMLASAFTEDGAQIIGPLSWVNRGRAAIEASANERLAGETLSATQIRARKISDTLIVHNGTWETRAPDGTLTGFGQWGNLLELQPDGSALLLVECAGPFHGAE